MHLHFESNVNTKCDCTILSLSWMGKVPDDIPEEEGWKLNRTNYYQEGWLATGNVRGIVGVTFTTSHCKKNMEYPLRTNYNLRGHRSDVILVKWNEPYQKLASCDSSGIIFVWIKYEGRWSIELINDRNTPVTHFSWSHDGRMALICYQDGFVLVGSVAGQRYWSSMLNVESTITCGIWTPDDQQVYFGTTHGQIIVMDVHGAMVSQVHLCNDVGITSMAWSCEKFKMEEAEENEPGVTNASKRSFVLAVCFQNGNIFLLKSYDDILPIQIKTSLNGALGLVMEWSNSRELLAVAGTAHNTTLDAQGAPVYENILQFYTDNGTLLYKSRIPNTSSPVSALTWGHNDKRLFIATGNQVHIAWVSRRIASLQLMCRLQIKSSIDSELALPLLPLPNRIRSLIGNLFAQTIRCCVPDMKSLREFVSRPPHNSTRLHCTMIRHDDESNISSGTCYTLYLEYLGGLVPLLKGKRTSKIRPEFVIFDPQVDDSAIFYQFSSDSKSSSGSGSNSSQSTAGMSGRTDTSDSDDKCQSPKTPRKRKLRIKKRASNVGNDRNGDSEHLDELAYVDTLPEEVKLVEVTSNIWGTKFKIHGLDKTVPANLGQVTYKTSLLHLQPRQMTLVITELRDDFPAGPDPTFNPNLFSEDEEEQTSQKRLSIASADQKPPLPLHKRLNDNSSPPIAPMSPRPNRFVSRNGGLGMSPLARAESYDDDSSNETMESSKSRPKNIAESPRAGPSSFTSFINSRSSSSSNSSQSRHAISPLCCEGSVPTLQSPKNAVAPSDIIFERPPVSGQTTLMSYSSSNDYTNNVVQVKSVLLPERDIRSTNAHVNPVPLNLNLNLERIDTKAKEKSGKKKQDIQFIDDENNSPQASSSTHENKMRRTPTIVSIAPVASDVITRSCSVGYLDNVDIVPSVEALRALRRDAPNKRLILVDKKKNKKRKPFKQSKLQQNNKSKSLDSCHLLSMTGNKLTHEKVISRLNEICESNSPPASPLIKLDNAKPCLKCLNNVSEEGEKCSSCGAGGGSDLDSSSSVIANSPSRKTRRNYRLFESFTRANKNKSNDNQKRKTEGITSFTDSPLFSRKHRFGNKESTETPILGRKADNGFSLVNRWKKKENQDNGNLPEEIVISSNGHDPIEATPVEPKASVSLHTQALTTLENIISRLRDLDEGRLTPPSSPQRLPRSSPASPAPSKKGKRYQSSSPIRHILNSPLLNRRQKKKHIIESSDEESNVTNGSGEECNGNGGKQYRDLETFQKAQLRQKRGKIEPNGQFTNTTPKRREFVMHNKAPMWNEMSQVYQLDFGGRVTQESAKNFQIEFRTKQVMQFGRIDGNAYTLDFQYPFSALQAFAVALANVTQRLK
ncbi:TULP4 family protein [Megaselia abdita]